MELLDLLAAPWRSGVERRALAEVVLLGAPCGALGFWVTSYRLSYGAESLAHALLPGLVLAAAAGVSLVAGAAGGMALAVAAVALASRDERLGSDTGTAVAVTGLVGLGGLLAFARDRPVRLAELLFGDPLAATAADIGAALALALLGGAALIALHRPLALVAFDPAAARTLGIRAGAVRAALLALLAAAVCVGVRGFGSLLVLAAIVAPALAVRRHARHPVSALAGGAAVAAVAGIAGIYASHHLDVAAGAAVALCLCGAAAAGLALPVRRPRPA